MATATATATTTCGARAGFAGARAAFGGAAAYQKPPPAGQAAGRSARPWGCRGPEEGCADRAPRTVR
eukprot:9502489-Pyramimonas_sp.AAC.1